MPGATNEPDSVMEWPSLIELWEGVSTTWLGATGLTSTVVVGLGGHQRLVKVVDRHN